MHLLINLSNHPSSKWSDEQRTTALAQFTNILDIPFPQIDPIASTADICQLAEEYLQKCYEIADNQAFTIHLMGEMTFTYTLVALLQQNGITCLASTTHRKVLAEEGGKKTFLFEFIQFREYPLI